MCVRAHVHTWAPPVLLSPISEPARVWPSLRGPRARGVRARHPDGALGACCHRGPGTAPLASSLPHPALPSRQEKEHTFLRQRCSQGSVSIHHAPPEKCKYAPADSGIIYYPRLPHGLERARLPAKPYPRFPWEAGLGGQSRGGREAEGEAGALAAGLGLCRRGRAQSTYRVEWSCRHLGTRVLESVQVCRTEGWLHTVPRHMVFWGWEPIHLAGA